MLVSTFVMLSNFFLMVSKQICSRTDLLSLASFLGHMPEKWYTVGVQGIAYNTLQTFVTIKLI